MEKQPTADGLPVYCAFDEIADAENLKPHPRNPNTHPRKQIALLAKILESQGWRAPITISRRSGYVVRGHGRLEAAKRIPKRAVPVDWQDYADEASEYADLIADNRIAELSTPDFPTLAELLADLDGGGFDLELAGFDRQWVEDAKAKLELMAAEATNDYSELMGPAITREPAPKDAGQIQVTIEGPDTVLTEEAVKDLRRTWSAAGAKVTVT